MYINYVDVTNCGSIKKLEAKAVLQGFRSLILCEKSLLGSCGSGCSRGGKSINGEDEELTEI